MKVGLSWFRSLKAVVIESFFSDLGSEEESGKDWSDLEREAAEEDRNRDKDGYAEEPRTKKRSHHR